MNSILAQLNIKQEVNNSSETDTCSLSSLAAQLFPQRASPSNYQYELMDWPYLDEGVTMPSEVSDLCKSLTEQTVRPERTRVEFPSADSMRQKLQERRNRQAIEPEVIAPVKEPVENIPVGSVEVYSDRPFFHYRSTSKSTTCSYGSFTVSHSLRDERGCFEDNEEAIISYTSALDVYDRYGLAICSAYLKSLYVEVVNGSYSNSRGHAQCVYAGPSLLAYVTMSLAGLDIEEARSCSLEQGNIPSRLSKCCLTFLNVLSDYDERQPRLATELKQVTCELPIEVLAMIFRSRRVSMKIGEHFMSLRLRQRRSLLRQGELSLRALYVPVVQLGTRIWTSKSTMMILEEDRITFGSPMDIMGILSLSNITQEEVRVSSHLYSWRDYARLTKSEKRKMFEEIIKQVDLSDIAQLCSWILMLTDRHKSMSSNIIPSWENGQSVQSLTHEQARELYLSLVAEVLSEYV